MLYLTDDSHGHYTSNILKINNQFIKNNKNTFSHILGKRNKDNNQNSQINIIRSKLHYGAPLYRTASKFLLNMIDRVNNNGLRLAILLKVFVAAQFSVSIVHSRGIDTRTE